ncbi:hypothetical protein HQ545_03335 [Candidatus Woesearchaeota archaeon]|nr:hypothetical protein [Candidatus Woesearchaeota archaeon]
MVEIELVMSGPELEEIAEHMLKEIRDSGEDIVSRYTRVFYDRVSFINGKKSHERYARSQTNKEMMGSGIYTMTHIDNLLPHNINEVFVTRDLQSNRFNFCSKGISLPTDEGAYVLHIPSNVDLFDEEIRQFTKDHPNTGMVRSLEVDQKIVVNSRGGIAIQSIPFVGISYSHGYAPIPINRNIAVVCSTDDDMKRLPSLIKYIADPTPDKRIKTAGSFSDAFHELHAISGLRFGSLEEVGIPLAELYDVVMLTGVPVHEIFGHHFEEPIHFLDFGESGTFRYGQRIHDKEFGLSDNPLQEIDGFRVLGFTHFDAYGRKREKRDHIKDGEVVGFLGSEYADQEKLKQFMNMETSPFVGNAVQHEDGQFPQPRMSCTVLDGRTEDVDLEGKILIVAHEGRTQSQDKTYMVKAHECYVVQDGVPKRVVPLQVTGGINQALANITLLDDESYQTGMCGKPEPMYYPQSRGNAKVPVSQFTKSQMWRAQQVYPLPISDVHLRILQNSR